MKRIGLLFSIETREIVFEIECHFSIINDKF